VFVQRPIDIQDPTMSIFMAQLFVFFPPDTLGPRAPNLIVFFIPRDWDDAALKAYFESYGTVETCKVMMDRPGARRARGIGFVVFLYCVRVLLPILHCNIDVIHPVEHRITKLLQQLRAETLKVSFHNAADFMLFLCTHGQFFLAKDKQEPTRKESVFPPDRC